MASVLKQNPDGTLTVTKSTGNDPIMRVGGAAVPTTARAAYHGVQVAKVPLVASDTAGAFFKWRNPELGPVLVLRLVLDITTPSSGACTVDCGIDDDGATLNDTLIDGASIATAAKLLDNISDAGTNGKARQRLALGYYVNGSVASGASAGVVGHAYIEYVIV